MEDPLSGKSGPPQPPPRRLSHPLSVPPSKALEERIKEELTLLGLFEPVEVGVASPEGVWPVSVGVVKGCMCREFGDYVHLTG